MVDDRNEAEARIWSAFPRGEFVDLRGTDGDRPAVRAEVVAALLMGARDGERDRAAAVRLAGARITGRLGLGFAVVGVPLLLEDCELTDPPDLYWGRLGFVSLVRCAMPALFGSGVTVGGYLRLTGCRIDGEVRLAGAHIGGALLLDGAHLAGPLHAQRIQVGGDLVGTNGFTAEAMVRLYHARIGGTLDFDRSVLNGGGGPAFDGDNVIVGANVLFREAQVDGQLSLRDVRVAGVLALSGATLRNPGGLAVRAERASVDGGVFLMRGTRVSGELRLTNARIGRTLSMYGARLDNPGGCALRADRLVVEGSLDAADGFHATGEVHLIGARVSGPVHFGTACLENPGHDALNANGISVGAVMSCSNGFVADGLVRLAGAEIASRLSFDDAELRGGAAAPPYARRGAAASDVGDAPAPGGAAAGVVLRCWRLRAGELAMRLRTAPSGTVDLRHAQVGLLRDDPATWPAGLRLDGFGYDALQPPGVARHRLDWLRRDVDGYRPQPYEQLATAYRRLGHDADVRAVLLAKQRRHRATMPWYARTWGLLQDATVGYGYRPLSAALWLVALFAIGTWSFAAHHPAAVDPAQAPPFSAPVYTLDLLLPIIDFGQQNAFAPRGAQQWLAYALIGAGWVLATTVAAGLARALRRD